jgi:hypothetical protein
VNTAGQATQVQGPVRGVAAHAADTAYIKFPGHAAPGPAVSSAWDFQQNTLGTMPGKCGE